MTVISRGRTLALGLGVVSLALGACGGSGSDLGPSPLVLAMAPTESGDQQTAPLGTSLQNEIRVLVTRDGVPEAGVSVTWSVVVGSVDPVTLTTGPDGIGATKWTLGAVAGAQTAQAVVSGATGSPVTFTATATVTEPPPPVPLAPLVLAQTSTQSGDGQTGPVGAALANDLRVIATRDGVVQSGVTVTWAAADGTLDPASSVTGADGVGATSWTLGPTVGSQTATATVPGATGSPVTFTAMAMASGPPPPPPPPPPSSVKVTVGNDFFKSVSNASTHPAVDTVAVNGTVTWTWTSTGTTRHSVESTGSPRFTSSIEMMGDGMTYSFRFTQPGTYTYDCAVHGPSMDGTIVVR
jgi:plastocyanin